MPNVRVHFSRLIVSLHVMSIFTILAFASSAAFAKSASGQEATKNEDAKKPAKPEPTVWTKIKKLYSTPPAKTESCVEVIDMLNGLTRETTCEASPAPLKKVPPKPMAPPEFKPEGELLRYLECYAVEPGRYDLIKDKYMPIIDTAAKEFFLPKTFLACLMFRESRFDVHAKSPTNAKGLGQHVGDAMEHITNIIRPPKGFTQDWFDYAMSTPQDYAKFRGIKLGGTDGKAKLDQVRKDINFYKTKLENREYSILWESYYDELRARKLHKGETPLTVSSANISDPKVSIGATALYVRMILTHFQNTLNPGITVSNSDGSQPNYDLLLVAAGAYNMGPGAAADILKSIKPPDEKKWIDALVASNKETAAQVLSVRNCVESEAKKAGNAWEPPVGSHKMNCQGQDMTAVVGGRGRLPTNVNFKYETAQMKQKAKVAKKKTEDDTVTAAAKQIKKALTEKPTVSTSVKNRRKSRN